MNWPRGRCGRTRLDVPAHRARWQNSTFVGAGPVNAWGPWPFPDLHTPGMATTRADVQEPGSLSVGGGGRRSARNRRLCDVGRPAHRETPVARFGRPRGPPLRLCVTSSARRRPCLLENEGRPTVVPLVGPHAKVIYAHRYRSGKLSICQRPSSRTKWTVKTPGTVSTTPASPAVSTAGIEIAVSVT